MQLVFHGHACFSVITKGVNLLIDPYLTGNSQAQKTPADFAPTAILLTHGHQDHLGDALTIAKNSKATIIAQVDLLAALDTTGITTIGFNVGGVLDFQGLKIRMVPAIHGNNIGGKAAGLAVGYIISDGEHNLYHAGDTALFADMQLVFPRYRISCALLPVGGFYTMDMDDALTAVEWLKAPLVVPMHYQTFPILAQDISYFCEQVNQLPNTKCVALAVEQELQL